MSGPHFLRRCRAAQGHNVCGLRMRSLCVMDVRVGHLSRAQPTRRRSEMHAHRALTTGAFSDETSHRRCEVKRQYSNVMSTLALFIAIGGGAYAATVVDRAKVADNA